MVSPAKPIFAPVHRLERCKLGVAFGDEDPQVARLDDDVLERIVNRVSTNSLAMKVRCSSVTSLDRYVARKLVHAGQAHTDQELVPYFTRLASGSPRLRRTGRKGPPLRTLHERLAALGDDAQELWTAAAWVFFELIHPQPLDDRRIAANVGGLPARGNLATCVRLTNMDSTEKQVRQIRDLLGSGDLVAGLTALWWRLRRCANERDLIGYALLYGLWLESRGLLEKSSLFHKATELLYAHTACWFGQVSIQLNAYDSPLERPDEFLASLREKLAQLWGNQYLVTPPIGLWDTFQIQLPESKTGISVRPRSDVAAFVGPSWSQNTPDSAAGRLRAMPLPRAPIRDGLPELDFGLSAHWHPAAFPGKA